MKIVNGFDLLAYAKEKKLLLPAFNTTNLEMTKAIIKGLNAVHLPGMVQISSNNLHLSNPEVIAYMMREFLKGTDTPVGLHLDHGKSFDDVKACVDAAKIDLALLKRIAEVSPVPLVLHGGSGIPFDQVKQMRDYNMIKVNYGSDLRRAFIQ